MALYKGKTDKHDKTLKKFKFKAKAKKKHIMYVNDIKHNIKGFGR